MKKFFIFTLSNLLFLLFSSSYAGDLDKQGKNENSCLAPAKLSQISAQYFNALNYTKNLTWQDNDTTDTTLTKEQRLALMPGYKLPKRALFFSALIPGAGELYAKSYIKAGVFFLAEVAAWLVYGDYTSKGNKQEDKFQQYADANWDSSAWLDWRRNYQNPIGDAHDSTMIKYIKGDKSVTTKQQYYEMIGKYPVFYPGWNFSNEEYPGIDFVSIDMEDLVKKHEDSPQVGTYMDMRDKSNEFFRMARTATNYVIVNHILSAIDAAWTAKRHNNKLLEASLRVDQIFYVDQLQPVLSLTIEW